MKPLPGGSPPWLLRQVNDDGPPSSVHIREGEEEEGKGFSGERWIVGSSMDNDLLRHHYQSSPMPLVLASSSQATTTTTTTYLDSLGVTSPPSLHPHGPIL